jgi:signal transduction histidine kinase
MAVFYATSCALFIVGLAVKWEIQGAILADCEGLDNARSAITRMRYVSVAVWFLFPIADALHRGNAIGNLWAELLTSGSDVFAKCILSGALKHGILCSGEDRKRLRLQGVSVTLVEQLRQQDKRKDRFFSAMTHELRTPLNGIIGLIDMLLLTEKSMSPKCQQSLRSASETGRRFQTLIDSILDHASLQENKLTLHRQPMSVHHLVDEVSVLIEPIVSKRTELRVELPGQLPLLFGDYNRLIQVLFNLMGNAAKFTDSGHITVSATEDTRMVELTISDTGALPFLPLPLKSNSMKCLNCITH